jgi:hypothetical protein
LERILEGILEIKGHKMVMLRATAANGKTWKWWRRKIAAHFRLSISALKIQAKNRYVYA